MEIQEADIRRMQAALSGMEDPRRQWGNVRHRLTDILVIGLCSTITRGEGFDEMEELGRAREGWFRTFLELPEGIPDEDTFRRVLERVKPAQLTACLQQRLCRTNEAGGREINLDGKTIRGSACGERKGNQRVGERAQPAPWTARRRGAQQRNNGDPAAARPDRHPGGHGNYRRVGPKVRGLPDRDSVKHTLEKG